MVLERMDPNQKTGSMKKFSKTIAYHFPSVNLCRATKLFIGIDCLFQYFLATITLRKEGAIHVLFLGWDNLSANEKTNVPQRRNKWKTCFDRKYFKGAAKCIHMVTDSKDVEFTKQWHVFTPKLHNSSFLCRNWAKMWHKVQKSNLTG